MKQKTEKALFNARYKFSEHCRSIQWDKLMKQYIFPKVAGAYTLNGKQMLCNKYCGGVYDNVYDGLVEIPNDIKQAEYLDLEKIIASTLSRIHNPQRTKNIDIEAIRKACKQARADKQFSYENDRGKRFVFQINSSYFDVQYFLLVADTLDDITFTLSKDPTDALYLVGKNGVGMVMPINVRYIEGATGIKPFIKINTDSNGGK